LLVHCTDPFLIYSDLLNRKFTVNNIKPGQDLTTPAIIFLEAKRGGFLLPAVGRRNLFFSLADYRMLDFDPGRLRADADLAGDRQKPLKEK